MYSLNKCKSVRELQQWLKYSNVSDEDILIITPKFDGISLVVEGIVGDRIAQLVIIPFPQIELEESMELSNTDRGTGGFGHTGN
jgi:dUTPase